MKKLARRVVAVTAAATRAIHVFDPTNGANLTLAEPATSKSAT